MPTTCHFCCDLYTSEGGRWEGQGRRELGGGRREETGGRAGAAVVRCASAQARRAKGYNWAALAALALAFTAEAALYTVR